MAEVGYATLGIIPSFDGFERRLTTGTTGPMSAAGRAGGDSFGRSFNTRLKSAVKIGAAGVAVAAAGAFKFAGDSLEEAREAQKVGAQTRAVIKSTGGAAKVTERSIGRLAGRLSDMAGIDDELIQSGTNVLLTFTKIRNEAGKGNKVFDRATAAALNMSVALDSDLKSASIQVGKALNDPVKGVTALGRAGVQFSEDQKAAIKTMVEQGNTLDAQRLILRELDTQFKGSARAQATEADKLGVAWGNLKEEVGAQLIPVMDDLAVFLRKKGIPAAKDFFGWVQDEGVPAMQDFGREVKPVVELAKDFAGALNDLPKSVKVGGLGAIAALFAGSKLRGGNAGALGTAGKVLGVAKPVPVFVTNAGALGGGIGSIGGKTKFGLAAASLYVAGAVTVSAAATKVITGKLVDDVGPRNASSITSGTQGGGMSLPASAYSMFDGVEDKVKDLRTNVQRLDSTITNMGPYRVGIEAPALRPLYDLAVKYDGILEGIPRTVRTDFIQSVQGNNVVPDIGGNGGRTPRTTTNDNRIIINGDIRPHNFAESERDLRRKQRARSGGGR